MPAKLPDDERIKRAKARRRKRAATARAKAKALPKFKQPRGRGRPVVYEEEAHCPRAHKLALLGLTEAEIAMQFGVSEPTILDWKKKYPNFSRALNDGKTPFDAEVAYSMGQRAVGFEHPAVKIFMPQGSVDKDGNPAPVYAPYMEYHPPDVNAGFRWLYNRQRHLWKDRQHVDTSLTVEHRIANMSPEERAQDARLFAARIRDAIAEARRARQEQQQLTIEGTATEED